MTRSLGIDVGASLIRVAEIETHARARQLVGLYELTREEGVPAGVTLRNFFESSNITGERIGIGTGAHPLIVRTFEFPFQNQKKIESAIRNEFEDTLPFDISHHILEVRPMGRLGKMFRFIGGLIPQESLDELDRICDDAGILANAYFPDTEALAQLALNQNLPAAATQMPYLICDLGYASTKLAFVRGGRPKFLDRKSKDAGASQILELRTISRGGRELVQWIREKNVLSQEDALQWLIHRAEILPQLDDAPPALTSNISDEIKSAIRPVIVEIYQTIQSFKMRQGVAPVAVYLTGGLTGLKGLREFLSHELRVPFHPWPIFEGFDTTNLPLSIERERSFAVALALAHRWSFAPTGGWLNFKRMTAQKKVLSTMILTLMRPEFKRVLTGVAAALAVVFFYNFAAGLLLSRQMDHAQNDLVGEFRRIDRDLGKRAAKFGSDPDRAGDIFAQEKKKRISAEANRPGSVPPLSRARAEILLDLSEALPPGVTLKEVSIAQIPGQAPEFKSSYTVTKDPSPQELAQTQTTLSQTLKARGYVDVALESSKTERNTVNLRAKWKGAAK